MPGAGDTILEYSSISLGRGESVKRRSEAARKLARRGGDLLDEGAKRDLDLRLNRIAGQLEGVRRMVHEQRLCVDILQQVASVEAALKAVGDKIIQFHVERCFVESIEKGAPNIERQSRELIDIVMRYLGR